MKHPDPSLPTPIYVKSDPNMPWPKEESVFYILSRNGLKLCRNTQYYSSCVPVDSFPSALASQEAFCRLRFPKLPRRMLELAVGYFWRVGKRHGAEAAILLGFEPARRRWRLIVPKQKSAVYRSRWSGDLLPLTVSYDVPHDLPPDLVIVGDIHSHVDEPACASGMDKHDEEHRPGLHIIVGRLISRDPPDFHAEIVVDGMRFGVKPELVLEGYERRREQVPEEWMEQIQVEVRESSYSNNNYGGSYYGQGYSQGYYGPQYSSHGGSKRDEDDRPARGGNGNGGWR